MLYRMTTGSPIFGLRREIDRLFDDTFTREGSSWSPAADIRENDNEISIDLELPGIKPEDVEITAENGILTVRGEKRSEKKEGEDNRYHIVERSYGTFLRTFQLPQGIDEDQINAEFHNGILSIRIPKAALPQPKKIRIADSSQQKSQAAVGSGNVSGDQTGNNRSRGSGHTPDSASQRKNQSEMAGSQAR